MIDPHFLPSAPRFEPVSIFGSRVEDACGLGDGEGSLLYENNDQSSSTLSITSPVKLDFDQGSDREQEPSLGLGVFDHQSEYDHTLAGHQVEANHPVSTFYDINRPIHSNQNQYHSHVDHTYSPVLAQYPQVTHFSSNLSLPVPNSFDNSPILHSTQLELQTQERTDPIDSFPSSTTYPSSTLDFSTAPGQSIDTLIKSPTGLWTPLTSSIPLPFSSDIDQYPELENDFLVQGYQNHEYITAGIPVHGTSNTSLDHGLGEGEMTKDLLPFTPFDSDRQSTSTFYPERGTPLETDLKPSLPPCRANTYFSLPSVLGDQVHDLTTFGLKAAPDDSGDQPNRVQTQDQGQRQVHGYWNGDLGIQKLNVPDRGAGLITPNTSFQGQEALTVQMQVDQREGYDSIGRGDHRTGRYDLPIEYRDSNGVGDEPQRTSSTSNIGHYQYTNRDMIYHQVKSSQDPDASRFVYASNGSNNNNDRDLAIMGYTYHDTTVLHPRTMHHGHPPSKRYTPSKFQISQPPPHTYHHRNDDQLSINTHDTFYNPNSVPTPSTSSASTFHSSISGNPILPGVNQLFDNYTSLPSHAPTYSAPPSTIFPNALKWPHNHVYAPTPTHHRFHPAIPHPHGPCHSLSFPRSNEARSVSSVSPAYSLDEQDRGQNFNFNHDHDHSSRINRDHADHRQMEMSISPREDDKVDDESTNRDVSRSASPSPCPSLESEEGVEEEEDKEEVLSEYKPNRSRCCSNGKAKGKAKGSGKGKSTSKGKGRTKGKGKGRIPSLKGFVPAIIPCSPTLIPVNQGRVLGGYHIIYEDGIGWTDDAELKQTAEIRRKCFNCDMRTPPSWRKSHLFPGKILCNKCGIYERTNKRPRPQQQDDLKLRRNPTHPPSLGYEPLDYTTGPDTPPAANVTGDKGTPLSPNSTYSPLSLDSLQAQASSYPHPRSVLDVDTTPDVTSIWSHQEPSTTQNPSPASSITPSRLFSVPKDQNQSLDTQSRHLPPLPTITTYWNTQTTSAHSQKTIPSTSNNAGLEPTNASGRKISVTPYSRPTSERDMDGMIGRGRGKLRYRNISMRGAGI